MIEALREVIKRMHYPLEVMLVCVRGYASYPHRIRCGDRTVLDAADSKLPRAGAIPLIGRPTPNCCVDSPTSPVID